MNAFIDFEDKTVEKAIDKACAKLKISKAQLRYDIISHGSSGIFGLVGTKKALIRVNLPEPAPGTASPAGSRGGKPDRKAETAAVSALVDEAFGRVEKKEETLAPPAPPAASQPIRGAEKAVEADKTEEAETAIETEEAAEAEEVAEAEESVPEHRPEPIDPAKRQELAVWVTGFLKQVNDLISPEASVSVIEDNEVTRFEIKGGDAARLIGKRGQTLEAVQYLVEKAVIKQFGTLLPVEIDVEGYLDKRRADLTALAERLAQKAEQTGKPMVINRINAQDRRIVHLSLKENRNVRTQSVGNGDYRKLLILPKKKAGSKKSKNKTKTDA